MSDKNFFDFTVKAADGSALPLSAYKGKAVLVVNVASKCGFTPQYTGLEALAKKYSDKGLVVLGFPCNQFGAQEPGSNAEIQEFCQMTYGVSFPVLGKVDVNGDKSDPVYSWMKEAAPGVLGTELIKWNFTKFLINPNGKVEGRYAPATTPESLAKDIEKILPK